MNLNTLFSLLSTILTFGLTAATPPDGSFGRAERFKSGDRVCFIGDSITGGGSYHTYILAFYATRFPAERFEPCNCGVSGDSASGVLRRYDWDIAPHRPSVATVMLGMNDVDRELYVLGKSGQVVEKQRHEALKTHVGNMILLTDRLTRSGSSSILITPSIYDQTMKSERNNNFGVNDALKVCSDSVRQLANAHQYGIVEMHEFMNGVNNAGQAKNPQFSIIGDDRVHPGPVGHLLMAYAFLKAQGMSPTVATISVDATRMTTTSADNCTITNLNSKKDAVGFDCRANALPFPIDDAAKNALNLIPFVRELNQEIIVVTGLSPGQYELLIDGIKVLQCRDTELRDGVNLAVIPVTPQYKQAQQVLDLLNSRAGIISSKLRMIAAVRHFLITRLADQSPEAQSSAIAEKLAENRKNNFTYGVIQLETYLQYASAEAKLEKEAAALLDQAYTINQPLSRHFEIRKTYSNN